MAKRGSLDDFKAKKPGAEAADVPVLETVVVEPVTDTPASKAALVGHTLRLTPDAWRQPKFLCVDQPLETPRPPPAPPPWLRPVFVFSAGPLVLPVSPLGCRISH